MGILPQFNISKKKGSHKRTICFLLIVLYALVVSYFAPQPLRWYYYIIPAFLFVAGLKAGLKNNETDINDNV